MKENMQKIWQWFRDRKTNTLRKWRSTVVQKATSEEEFQHNNKRVGHSVSDINLPSTSKQQQLEFEQFFNEPQTKSFLDLRRQSFRDHQKVETFPVVPPDLDDDWIENSTPRATPRSTPRPGRSPRQIRFQIPEIQVSLDSSSTTPPLHSNEPPTEIEWSPARISNMDTVMQKTLVHPDFTQRQAMSFDEGDDGSSSSSRRNSASEKARQNLLAQRRQSQIQLVQAMSGRRASTTLIPLTAAQIHLIRALWRQIYTTKGPTVVGTSIYHRLCFKCPQVKEQIRRVPLPPKFQNHDSFVKAHCKAIGELIDQVVESLDNLDNMADELIRIGKVHARLLRGELTGKLWNVVAETFIDCTLEWGDRRCRSETVRKAWALIVAFVIEKIKLGHHEQRKLMLATRQSLPAIEVPFQSMKI
ncbi:hypothetical protein Y032_0041g341 [Ancylostoma ceylanicum]|uniref:Globin domain-containing protein n=2 Tax=Ancylostoma ceylanicum TaxID=53326 RepID=A0A016UH25_9BILA|nr:hypothetical protein Y032_0041g341 [Ancylostoma ceylanicum]